MSFSLVWTASQAAQALRIATGSCDSTDSGGSSDSGDKRRRAEASRVAARFPAVARPGR